MEIPKLFKNVSACKKIEIPPKEIMPVAKTHIRRMFISVTLKSKHPLVTSIIPFVMEEMVGKDNGKILDKTKFMG